MTYKTIGIGKIDLTGLKKVGIGALVAGAGATLTFLAEAVPGIDFGSWTPIVVSLFSIAVNFLRKLLSKYTINA